MRNVIGVARVSHFVENLFEEDLHAKRLLSLSNATAGAVRAGAMGVHAIGRGLAAARRSSAKHSIKQVDRLLSNPGIDVWALFARWVPYVVAARTEVRVVLDWTEFERDKQSTLVASLVTEHGRTTPLMWLSQTLSNLEAMRATEPVNVNETSCFRI